MSQTVLEGVGVPGGKEGDSSNCPGTPVFLLVTISGGDLVSLALVTLTQFPSWFFQVKSLSVRFQVIIEDVFTGGSLPFCGWTLCHGAFRPQT